MSITVIPYTGAYEKKWDAFVQSARNGTIFHTRKFLSYHPVGRFTDNSLLLMDGEKVLGVLSAAKKEEGGKKALVAHPGASYGGLVIDADASVQETGAMIDAVLEYARTEKFASVSMLRLPPASLQARYSEDQMYWLFHRGFSMTRCEMDGAIDVSCLAEEDIMESLTGKCRNMVRQAERAGITVKLTKDFSTFWPILEGVLAGRHGTKPTHTLAEIQSLQTLLPDGFRLLAAYEDKKMVGGIVLVTIHSQALYTLYMAQEYTSQQKHPMHLLLTEAIRLAIKEKRRVLHLGVSTEDGGKKINEGLFFFKESFGCRPVRRESFEITL
ncbi:MAG: GNAT family N-acetyltransferase [Candidatus Peribacteraceae bacterium]|nr:GNAT family N-acetyltransferase [Candidatus Peribacteraceae bacterium]